MNKFIECFETSEHDFIKVECEFSIESTEDFFGEEVLTADINPIQFWKIDDDSGMSIEQAINCKGKHLVYDLDVIKDDYDAKAHKIIIEHERNLHEDRALRHLEEENPQLKLPY